MQTELPDRYVEPKMSDPLDVLPDLRDGDIVPEDVQNELIMLRSGFTEAAFRIGDIANALIAQAAATGLRVTATRIFAAVGNFVGKSPRTVRYYAETAAAFGSEARQVYDTLPFSTFVLARSMGDQSVEVLEYALAHPLVSEIGLRVQFTSPFNTFVPDPIETDSGAPRAIRAALVGSERPAPYGPPPMGADTFRREIPQITTLDLFVELSVALDKINDMIGGMQFDMNQPEVKTALEEIRHGLALLRSGIPALNKVLRGDAQQ